MSSKLTTPLQADGVYKDISNADYHGDSTRLSSSDLKTLLKNPHQFYTEKILGQKERTENSAFDEGSLTHTLILEPHRLNEDFAFFPGLRKAGAEFEAFKLQNPGKTIISEPQKARCNYYYQSYKNRPEAQELISGGISEHTICQTIDNVRLKVRCDYINIDKGYIADVKTSGFPVDAESFKITVEQYMYQLSAALYCQVAEAQYNKPFDFYFVAISKKEPDCQIFKLSPISQMRGRKLVAEALQIYNQCVKTGVWAKQVESPHQKTDYEILEI